MDAVTVVTQESFDYAQLDAETRIVVQQRTGEIKTLVRRSAQDIIEIGQKLHEVKARLGHGNFGPWLTTEFAWGELTAQRFMQVASRFENHQIDGFAPSALYLLAAPSTPDGAVDEALNRAAAGETISHAAAKGIVQEHKPQPQYVSVWDLQRRVDEFARANGWQAPELRRVGRNQRNDENYVLLEAAITVDYRRSDLVQAIHNVANQWEDREEQQRKAREWQVVQLPADIAASGYQIHWKAAEGWRVLYPDGGHVQTGLNSLSECANLIRRLAPPAVPAGRPMMEVIKTDAELAAEAEAADIAEREAAADEAERQAAAAPRKVVRDWILVTDRLRNWLSRRHQDFTSEDADYSIRQILGYWMEGKWPAVLEEFTATLPEGWTQDALDDAIREVHAEYAPDFHPEEIDPWAAALATSGSRQHRAELLAVALQPWIREYKDEYGRNWRDLALHGNPSHSNSTFWRHITAEARRRSITAIQDDLWKFAIKQAFAWMTANEPSEAADVTPVTPEADADKLLVDWTDDDWETHALRSQAEAPAAEPQRRVDEDAILTPVSLRPDYDSDEWYTPAEYIEAARKVMGAIDLDPASCELAQTVVQADVYLTKIENGLGQMWIRETVWLNPPYGQAEPWVAKLLAEFDGGAFVQQAVVLLNNMTETAYFQALLTRFPVCFPNRRIPFWRHDQQGLTGRQGQALFYLGPNVERFVEVFGAFGPVLRRV